MSAKAVTATLEGARRLAVTRQHLAGRVPAKASEEDLWAVVSDVAYVQWDPISIVAPSHLIAFWSRLGNFRVSDLDRLLWQEKRLFLCWTPIASIVPTDDYPLHASFMQRYPESLSDSWGAQRTKAKKFLAEHKALRQAVLKELEGGPRPLTQFEDYVRKGRSADGWTPGSEISRMLSYLQMTGDVMVVGHEGNQNVWGLTRDFLPRWAARKELAADDAERVAAERAIRALGTASPREIFYYFLRGRYLNLDGALEQLEEESAIHRLVVPELGPKDMRYIHDSDVPLLDAVAGDAWEPRVALLAPFDTLICGRDRTNRLFGFDYAHEQFLPKGKRKFGTYVLPILRGDRLIGRVDPEMDHETGKLAINSVHAERGAPTGKDVSREIGEVVASLAAFLGAREVTYTSHVPTAWKSALR